jgi:hypothetical protein
MGQLAEYAQYLAGPHTVFVETGCFLGEGLSTAQAYFTDLYACDISGKYVKHCKKLFPQAILRHQDSLTFLLDICPGITGQAVFWLDAHYPTQYDNSIIESDSNKFPLYEELKVIRQRKPGYGQDLIICDDLRVIQSEDNPVRGDIGSRNLQPRHLMFDKTFAAYLDIFRDTHEYQLVGLDGLLFLPRHP